MRNLRTIANDAATVTAQTDFQDVLDLSAELFTYVLSNKLHHSMAKTQLPHTPDSPASFHLILIVISI